MTERLEKIYAAIPKAESIADIACDHGYIAKALLDRGKCVKAVVSDISAKSLSKAEKLLEDHVKAGRCQSVVADGFCGLPNTDVAVIAGVGGELIADMLKKANELPDCLVLSPMKHREKVCVTLLELGYAIEKDYVFKAEGQFYDVIVAVKGKDSLTEEELEFGRTNLTERPRDFSEYIKSKIYKYESYAEREGISEKDARDFISKAERLKKYV